MNKNYQLSLLLLTYLLISADGEMHEEELASLDKLAEKENIPPDVLSEFKSNTIMMREKDVYDKGIDLLLKCSIEEKIRLFVMLYKLSEADGRIHAKEVRLLLYSTRLAGVDFDHVVEKAKLFPSIFS
ncbi:MAG: TerB family tellurite resistance protein [Flammeovirgaceae bacterium]|nr:TerB family tellurite resistance protein [Flammeovirgaceae bacterium]